MEPNRETNTLNCSRKILPKVKIHFKNRIAKHSLEIVFILIIFIAVKSFLQRNLVEGVVPPLEGVLLGGQTFNIQSCQGQPTLLHFWATWCSTCKMEENSISAISEDYQVITIAMNSGADQEIKDYLEKREISFPVIVDEYGEVAKRFGVRGVPTSFVIDSQGNIDFTEVGYTTNWGLRLRLWLAGS